jgi:hypothetical protein
MNRRLFSILGLIILSILLFGAGLWVGQTRAFNANWQPGWMMGNTNNVVQPGYNNMMGNAGMMGMMDYNNGQYMPGMMNGQAGNMMGGTDMMGMMGGSNMMGSFDYAPDAESNITADEAADIAQEYLDAYLSGKTADEHVDAFPGYYTLHVLEDGETVGMLSVNAYTGQVFLHHWHGEFIEMTAGEHE